MLTNCYDMETPLNGRTDALDDFFLEWHMTLSGKKVKFASRTEGENILHGVKKIKSFECITGQG